jgi:hypothetical protein
MENKNRFGLYLMVFFVLLNSCEAADNAREAHRHTHAIAEKLGVDPAALQRE